MLEAMAKRAGVLVSSCQYPKLTHSSLLLSTVLLTGIGFVSSACGQKETASGGSKEADASKASAATLLVTLPASSQFTVAQQLQLTGYRLVATPAKECAASPKVDVVGEWADTISQSLARGCTYAVSIQLGTLQGGQKLKKEIFTNHASGNSGQTVSVDDDAGAQTVMLDAKFFLTDTGKKSGFAAVVPTASGSIATDDETSGDSDSEQDQGSLPPTGSVPVPEEPEEPKEPKDPVSPAPAPPVSLPAAKNVTLTAPDGSTQKLSNFFTAKYLVIAASQASCGICISLSRKHEADDAFKGLMEGANCRFLTALPNQDLSPWMTRFEQSPFIAASSFGIGTSIGNFINKYGVPVQGTPTFFVIDQTGGTVAYGIGSVPPEVNGLCGGN